MIKIFKDIGGGALSLIKGMAITLKYCLRPAVTLQYPTKKQAMVERYRGLVDLIPEKCIMCYQCVKICPTGCLAITHKEVDASAGSSSTLNGSRRVDKKKTLETFRYNMELCCFCGMCQQVCPTSAVTMNKIYEISVYDRQKLYIDLLKDEKYAEWVNPSVR